MLHTPVVGDVLDALGRSHQFLPPTIRSLRQGDMVVGRAMPVLVADVFGAPHKPFGQLTEALDALEPGDVYVARGARTPTAAWGEIMTVAAEARGAAGAVLDAYHRDTPRVRTHGLPVFSIGGYGQDAAIRSVVMHFREPIEIGGVVIRSGDLIIGDDDGVLVIPQEVEAEVLERALDKALTENHVLDAIAGGMSATDAFRTYGVL